MLTSPGVQATSSQGPQPLDLCDRAYQDCKYLTEKQDEQIKGLTDALKNTEKQRDTAISRGDALVADGHGVTKSKFWEVGIFIFGVLLGVGSQRLK